MAKHMFLIVLLLTTGCAQHRMYLLPGDLSSKSKEIHEIQKFFRSKPGTFHALPRTVAKATVALTRVERSETGILRNLVG